MLQGEHSAIFLTFFMSGSFTKILLYFQKDPLDLATVTVHYFTILSVALLYK